jgi:hypothetical protein
VLVSRKNFLEHLKEVDFVWWGNIKIDWPSAQQECYRAVENNPQYWCSLVVGTDEQDSWDSIGDDYYDELTKLKKWGYTKYNTQSWETTSASPPLTMSWEEEVASKLPIYHSITRPTLQQPGNIMPWHEDKFFYFKRLYPNLLEYVCRFIVFQNDWSPGQIIQAGNSICSHWKAGDAIVWYPSRMHLSANAGVEDKWTCNITGVLQEWVDWNGKDIG